LFPFIWGTVATRGQIFGNRTQGSDAHVTNGRAFSYPGYNEMSVGFPNPAITSNEFGPNPNVSVFEWLNGSPDLAGHVAIYGTWHNYYDIFNQNAALVVPRPVDRDVTGEIGRPVQPLKHADVGIRANSLLVMAGLGKPTDISL